jgi:hypothetical protein
MPEGVLAETDFATHRIDMTDGMLQRERRSVLTHELVHLERGPCLSFHESREERAVDAETARRLITCEALADALLWSSNETELAEELWVSDDLVRVRLDTLTPGEKSWIEAEIARKEESA